MDDVVITTIEKRMFVGADGREYETEADAARSIVRGKLADLLAEGGGVYYDFDTLGAADALLQHSDKVMRWLALAQPADK